MFSKQFVQQSKPISIRDSFLRIIKAGAELTSNTNLMSRFRIRKAVNPLSNRLHGMQMDKLKFDVY
jgi:hypothetical protein